jgi:DNA recombination protein RmuC
VNQPTALPITIVISVLSLVLGLLVGWLATKSRPTAHEAELTARLESERTAAQDKHGFLEAQARNQAAELQGLREKMTALTAKEAEVSGRLQSEQSAARGLHSTFEAHIREQESELRSLRVQVNSLTADKTELATRIEAERSGLEEKLRLLNEAEKKLTDAFKAISADALSRNNQAFLDLAKLKLSEVGILVRGDLEKRQQAISELVSPVRASLEKVDERIQQLERVREGAYSALREQVRNLGDGQTKLQAETAKLVTALHAPAVRGRWGEIQLQRVVEMAGMVEHCDFITQPTVEGEDGRLRPDLIVRLPGGKSIVVDAKAPLAAYLKAIDTVDENTRKTLMQDHAAQVRTHLQVLGRKSYAGQFQPSPDFVVLFLPGESFFSAALENDPMLIEFGLDQNVVLATPTTLIALLRTAAYGWQQEALAQNAAEISAAGKELYRRISGMIEQWTKVGVNLSRAVHAYNNASTTLESRVLVSARKFENLQTAPVGIEIKPVVPVERIVRTLGDGAIDVTDFDEVLPNEAEAPIETPTENTEVQIAQIVSNACKDVISDIPLPDPEIPDLVPEAAAPWWKQDRLR